jgi:hypothetical protein
MTATAPPGAYPDGAGGGDARPAKVPAPLSTLAGGTPLPGYAPGVDPLVYHYGSAQDWLAAAERLWGQRGADSLGDSTGSADATAAAAIAQVHLRMYSILTARR